MKGNDSGNNDDEVKGKNKDNAVRGERDALFDLAIYLIASARDCLEEPLVYGPLRMIVGVQRIIEIEESSFSPALRDEFLEKKREALEREVLSVMSDRERFRRALDSLLLDFADERKRRLEAQEH